MKSVNLKNQEAGKTPNVTNPETSTGGTHRNYNSDKEKSLESIQREITEAHRRRSVQETVNFPSETVGTNFIPSNEAQVLYLVKLFFRNKWKISIFSNERKWKEFVSYPLLGNAEAETPILWPPDAKS